MLPLVAKLLKLKSDALAPREAAKFEPLREQHSFLLGTFQQPDNELKYRLISKLLPSIAMGAKGKKEKKKSKFQIYEQLPTVYMLFSHIIVPAAQQDLHLNRLQISF